MDGGQMHIPTYDDMLAAHERIRPHIRRTPLRVSDYLNELTGAELFFKCENFQEPGAFKVRGAANAVFGLSDAQAEKGVATHSSGNHASCLAYAAMRRGIPCNVVMPHTAPQAKKDTVRRYGATITECEPSPSSREATFAKVQAETGGDFVHPYNDPRVIAGQGTCAREVMEQRPDPADDTLLQFQNVGRYVTAGVEAEASYRTSGGWYAFGGGAYARVGSAEQGGEIAYGHVVNAPALTLSGGLSTPRLGGYAHVSAEALFVSRRATRPTEDGTKGPTSPPWTGINLTVYVPNLRGFDLTAGVRNLIGRRDRVPAPGDYDRFPDMLDPVTVHRIPGEGRELYVKVGYSY